METKIDKANDFIRINHEKIKAPLFISGLIVFIAFILFWGITDKGYYNGIIAFINIITDHRDFIGYDGQISFSFYLLLFSLMLIPLSSGYLMYASWFGKVKYIKLVKIVLLISIFPFALGAIINPFSRLGLFISALAVAYMFLPKIGDTVISKAGEFIRKLKNNQSNNV